MAVELSSISTPFNSLHAGVILHVFFCRLWIFVFNIIFFSSKKSFRNTIRVSNSFDSVSLKTLLQQGISEPEFYGDLVYRFRKIVGNSNFSEQFRKLINRYKRLAIA